MSDTPETDEIAEGVDQSNFEDSWRDDFEEFAWVPAEFARKLERERNQVIEKHRLAVIYWQRDVFKMQRERDEALAEIQRLRFDAQREAEQHDRMVKELEGLYDQLAKTKSSNEHICSLSKDLMGNCIICGG